MLKFLIGFFLLLRCTLSASSDSELPKINPLWQEVFTYGYGDVIYDSEDHVIVYQFHLWLPWLMTHHPQCYCVGTRLELSPDVSAVDFEENRFKVSLTKDGRIAIELF